MLKCDVLLNDNSNNKINFADLPLGSTFIVNTNGLEWIGMKVATSIDWEEHDYYILDLSDECGNIYEDIEMYEYDIVRLIDLKVVEDEN